MMVYCRTTKAGPVDVPVLFSGPRGEAVQGVWSSAGPMCSEPVKFEAYRPMRMR